MRLYQHSARCPIALRSFLDCNPEYWCFIPLRWDEALGENTTFLRRNSVENSLVAYLTDITTVADSRVQRCLDRVPLPPAAYVFSYRQLQQQRLFYKKFTLSNNNNQVPYVPIDLYKAAIIAVRKLNAV